MTSTRLRRAFSDIRFEIHEIALTGDRAVAWVTMHPTDSGPFVVHESADGTITDVFPPTGRRFAAPQAHWFRIADGAVAKHDAVHDDLGMARQAGWIPPRPGYIVAMLLARRRERRAMGQPRRNPAPRLRHPAD